MNSYNKSIEYTNLNVLASLIAKLGGWSQNYGFYGLLYSCLQREISKFLKGKIKPIFKLC